jgi:hypothetical protein
VPMALRLQRCHHALHTFGQALKFGSTHIRHPARLLSTATATRELGLRPRKSLM